MSVKSAIEKANEVAAKAIKKKTKTAKKSPVKIVFEQVPIWPEDKRGLPNPIARSALFNVRFKKTPRVQLKNHSVSALEGIDIVYTGEELRQDDETVLLQLLHMARAREINEPIKFTPYSFLKAIKWPTSGQSNYVRLSECTDRLAGNLVKVTIPKLSLAYKSSLVRKIYNTDDETGSFLREWQIWLEPEIINLFKTNSYSRIHWDQRLQLKKPIAQWLHSFYTSHRNPHPMKVSKLMELSEAAAKTIGSFRTSLKKALDDLVKIGFLYSYRIDRETDKVFVKRAEFLGEANGLPTGLLSTIK